MMLVDQTPIEPFQGGSSDNHQLDGSEIRELPGTRSLIHLNDRRLLMSGKWIKGILLTCREFDETLGL
jgi:hypothetical protein